MSEAKVPDNKSDWTSIDIYIFNNGQKSSPPRKYHLVIDQLDWWKATLIYLAKSQYGFIHNMVDLYTIEGQKVEAPMQLSHNTAYVAVVPPDLFINASYEKYLLKATRSWEKSQIRRYSNTLGGKPEEIPLENGEANDRVFETAKVTRDGSTTLKTIVASTVDNQASVIVKPEVTSVKKNNNTINLNPVKRSDGTPKPTIVKSPSIVKRNSTSPPRSRKPSLKRKDSVKINMIAMKDRPSSESNKISPKSKMYKPLHKPRDSLAESTLAKVEEVLNEVKSSQSLKLVNTTGSKAFGIENIEDKEGAISSNYYMNANAEKPSIAVNPKISLSNNVDRQGGAHELFDESHQFFVHNWDKLENVEESKLTNGLRDNSITNNTTLMEHGLSAPIFTKVIQPENDVAPIDKEGTVNLKLNIEIWNYSNDAKYVPTVVSERDSLVLLRQEKGSQFDFVEKLIDHNQTIANEISDERNHKIIIVKCACLKQDGEKTIIPVGNMVFLPILKLDENCKRCDCKESKETDSSSQSTYVEHPVNKTNSVLMLYAEKVERIASHTEITSRNNSTENKLETNTIHDKNDMMITLKRKSVAIKEGGEMHPQPHTLSKQVSDSVKEDTKVLKPLESEKSECIVMQKESVGILHKSSNKFTQTEWCDVLLQVKLQNDGHYSLHLPPLEVLKNYKVE